MRKGLSSNKLERMPVIEYSQKELRSNPIVNLFIRCGREWASVEIDKFLDFIGEFLDGTSTNDF